MSSAPPSSRRRAAARRPSWLARGLTVLVGLYAAGVLATDEPELAEVDTAAPPSALRAIADLHRGETVVVLVPGLVPGETPFVRRELD